ncbi:MAG: propionyl-CoA--succinate CoA transferase [Acidimicrobiales bacterium]|nr:propionyl-CoA--succinate CoA transferase [Acidimicrobiales bacterium]
MIGPPQAHTDLVRYLESPLGVISGDRRTPLTVDDLAEQLVKYLPVGSNVVVPIANGEPVALLDALEARAHFLTGVRIHQMHALRDRPYLHGAYRGHLDHVSWFLSHVVRGPYLRGECEFTPANFSEVPQFMADKKPVAVLAAASPPDNHGYFSLGLSADYAAALIGKVPFILEVNPLMPRTHGGNRLHVADVLAWCEASTPLIEVPPAEPGDIDRAIAASIVDRIRNGSTMQLGIGAIPSAVATFLADHRDLGVHTELLTDPIVDLVECGAVTGLRKNTHRGYVVTTFALGTRRLYDFVDNNDLVQFVPVDLVNDPRRIGEEDDFVSINATLEVDLFGQCASETLGTRYFSGSGGQADFARGAQYSKGGQGFVVLRSTTRDGSVSKITPTLSPGAVVTTQKNTVDKVVTEYGIAELQGRSIRQRARALIAIAHPDHREKLERDAHELGILVD